MRINDSESKIFIINTLINLLKNQFFYKIQFAKSLIYLIIHLYFQNISKY